jgi:L-serine dehydratase
MAVNEENAAGGQVVTAPTNGAAGVVPAVIRYWLDHVPGASDARIARVPSDGGGHRRADQVQRLDLGRGMWAARRRSVRPRPWRRPGSAPHWAARRADRKRRRDRAGASPRHDLRSGGGLVQVPCIERNGLGAIKAVSAASLALRGDGTHFVPLDNCIEAMRQTGLDMSTKYKETSQGGLAVNLPEC